MHILLLLYVKDEWIKIFFSLSLFSRTACSSLQYIKIMEREREKDADEGEWNAKMKIQILIVHSTGHGIPPQQNTHIPRCNKYKDVYHIIISSILYIYFFINHIMYRTYYIIQYSMAWYIFLIQVSISFIADVQYCHFS